MNIIYDIGIAIFYSLYFKNNNINSSPISMHTQNKSY